MVKPGFRSIFGQTLYRVTPQKDLIIQFFSKTVFIGKPYAANLVVLSKGILAVPLLSNFPKKMRIANPIYDVVFKYLLEDTEIAREMIERSTRYRQQRNVILDRDTSRSVN